MNADLTEEEIEYGMNDVRVTYQAFFSMADKVAKFDLEVPYGVEIKAILPTVEMEAAGLNLDRAAMDDLAKDLEETRATSLPPLSKVWTPICVSTTLIRCSPRRRADQPQQKDHRLSPAGNKKRPRVSTPAPVSSCWPFNTIGIDPTDPLGKPSVDKKYSPLTLSVRSFVTTCRGSVQTSTCRCAPR